MIEWCMMHDQKTWLAWLWLDDISVTIPIWFTSNISAYATARHRTCATTSHLVNHSSPEYLIRSTARIRGDCSSTLNIAHSSSLVCWQILVLCPIYIFVWTTQTVNINLYNTLYWNEDTIEQDLKMRSDPTQSWPEFTGITWRALNLWTPVGGITAAEGV